MVEVAGRLRSVVIFLKCTSPDALQNLCPPGRGIVRLRGALSVRPDSKPGLPNQERPDTNAIGRGQEFQGTLSGTKSDDVGRCTEYVRDTFMGPWRLGHPDLWTRLCLCSDGLL